MSLLHDSMWLMRKGMLEWFPVNGTALCSHLFQRSIHLGVVLSIDIPLYCSEWIPCFP